MLKIYDQQHVLKAQTDKFKDRKIESDVATGDKTLSLTLIGVPEITNEWYIDDGDQEYVVKEAKVSEKNMVAIVAALNLEGLEAKAWKLYSAKNATIVAAADLAVQGTDWTVAPSSITKRRNAGVMKKNALGVIQDLCTAFMCEVVFDTRNKTIYFYDQVGQDRGVYAMRGLNLRSLSRTGNSYDFYTRIIPYGEDDLDIKSVNGGVEYLENFQYSSKIRTYIWEDSNYDDPAALKEDAIAKLDDMSKPKVSYQANIIDLAAMSDKWALLDYSIGDTITLKDSETGICEKQRIVKMTEYPESPEKNTCELSNTTLTWEELQARLKAAAEIVNAVINTDGRYNGKIKVSDILNFEDGVVGEDEQQQDVTLSQALTIIETSANEANQHALEAGRAAVAAQEAADTAQEAADNAQESADNAMESALTANSAANGALAQLSVVEDVVGTLNWISTHGSYAATTDTEVVPGKYYFVRTGTAPDYSYNIVVNPTGNPQTQGWYELTSVDEAVSNYVATHLALTSSGLYVLMDNTGYKVRISGSDVSIIDQYGRTVAVYGSSAIVGRTDGTSGYLQIDPDSLKAKSKNGVTYFDVTDLAGEEITLQIIADGTSRVFYVYELDTSEPVSAKCGSTDLTIASYSASEIILANIPASGDPIDITYTVRSNASAPAVAIGGATVRAPIAIALNNGNAFGINSVSENESLAYGENSHAENSGYAYGENSHAEGEARAYGRYAHAEGGSTYAHGMESHAGGRGSTANGSGSFAHGLGVVADENEQTVFGTFNASDSNAAFIIGGGSSSSSRKNLFSVQKDGTLKTNGNELLSREFWAPTSYPSIASGSWSGALSGKTFDLSAGTYLVVFGADFDTNANGYRMVQFQATSTGGSGNRYTPTANAVTGNNTRLSGSMVIAPTSSTEYAMYAYQNSGSSLQVVPWVNIIRIK